MSLPSTAVFRNALPVDGQQHYSALGFVNASTLGSAIASAVPGSTDPNAQVGLAELRTLLSEASAMALCVTAERDRILITSTGIDLLNPSRALSFLSTLQPPAPGPRRQREPRPRSRSEPRGRGGDASRPPRAD